MANDSIIIKKKKVSGHGGHHGGSWKVAYADFVTAMMAFFMVMWIMGLSDETKMSISGYFNDPNGFMKNPPRSKNVITAINGVNKAKSASDQTSTKGQGLGDFQGLSVTTAGEGQLIQTQIQKQIAGIPDLKKMLDHIEVTVGIDGIRIELLEDRGSVFFQSGQSVVSPVGRRLIKTLAPVLIDTQRNIAVEGHTDAQPYSGNIMTNWELSGQRAIAVRQVLAYSGVPTARFRGVTGFADTKLKYPLKPLSPKNRRVSLLLPWDKSLQISPTKEANNALKANIAPEAINKVPSIRPNLSEGH
jgi:chemotaxis protein MotB